MDDLCRPPLTLKRLLDEFREISATDACECTVLLSFCTLYTNNENTTVERKGFPPIRATSSVRCTRYSTLEVLWYILYLYLFLRGSLFSKLLACTTFGSELRPPPGLVYVVFYTSAARVARATRLPPVLYCA